MSMSDEQNGQRNDEGCGSKRRLTAQEKVAILKEHLVDKAPISDVCDRHRLHVGQFYRWQKELFENGGAAFENRGSADARTRQLEGRIQMLEAKLVRKNEVIVELMEDHVRLKKELGEG
jgi:transposase